MKIKNTIGDSLKEKNTPLLVMSKVFQDHYNYSLIDSRAITISFKNGAHGETPLRMPLT